MKTGPLVVWLACSACGRIDFAAQAAVSDACVPIGWATPQRLDVLSSTGNDYGGQIAPDGLTYYFDSNRTGDEELYVAHRASPTAPFDPPQSIAELNTPAFDSDATVTGDELELFFQSNRDAGNTCIWTTTRPDPAATWGAPIEQPALCPTDAGGPFVTADGLTLYYNQIHDTVGEGTLMVSQRASRAEVFPAGTTIAELAGGANKGYAALSGDGLTIYYESEIDGTLHIWQASRPALDAAFGAPELVPGPGDEDSEDVSIMADGSQLFFASNRDGNIDLYVADRICR
jgi:hypothetical protein